MSSLEQAFNSAVELATEPEVSSWPDWNEPPRQKSSLTESFSTQSTHSLVIRQPDLHSDSLLLSIKFAKLIQSPAESCELQSDSMMNPASENKEQPPCSASVHAPDLQFQMYVVGAMTEAFGMKLRARVDLVARRNPSLLS